MPLFAYSLDSSDPRTVERAFDNSRMGARTSTTPHVGRQSFPVQGPAQSGTTPTLPQDSTTDDPRPPFRLTTDQSQSTRTPEITSCTDVPTLHSVIGVLQAELNATASVNTNLAASVARLQAELNAATSVNNHLAATVARFQAEQAVPTPAITTTTAAPAPAPATTTVAGTPLPCSHPDHPRTIASGRGAASTEVFMKIAKMNWHGRLGRTHMAEVDALPTAALTELDSFLRRKLYELYPRGMSYSTPDVDSIFASLAALGLRLEDRSGYIDLAVGFADSANLDAATLWRGRYFVGWYYSHDCKFGEYWKGFAVETLVELAKYRGLFDDKGYLI